MEKPGCSEGLVLWIRVLGVGGIQGLVKCSLRLTFMSQTNNVLGC